MEKRHGRARDRGRRRRKKEEEGGARRRKEEERGGRRRVLCVIYQGTHVAMAQIEVPQIQMTKGPPVHQKQMALLPSQREIR